MTFRKNLLHSSITPLALGVGLGIAVLGNVPTAHANPCAAKACAQNPCCAKNPCAAKDPCAANPCAANPCAAKNPCAANPCAANPCAAKNPCAANPCAANPCAAKNPCAANPCAANPCAAKNPCAANPCAANPCAAKNPCAANPCAANPCAAKNPCAANPCAANPCAAAEPAELTNAQAISEWDRLVGTMRTIYAKSGLEHTGQFFDWINVTKSPYQSSTHGGRYLVNIVNETGKNYAKWEKAGKLPAGSVIAKPTIVGKPDGSADIGPLFMMEKMPSGWNKKSRDWKYTMINADGSVWGVTGGQNSKGMIFCYECHNSMGEETDGLLFLPEEYRR